jgi:hypothetical protein
MKLHPRVMPWQAARADISNALGEAIARQRSDTLGTLADIKRRDGDVVEIRDTV